MFYAAQQTEHHEDLASTSAPRGSGSHEILKNVVGRRKHVKHQNVATEPRNLGMLTWMGQGTCNADSHLPAQRADAGRLH